MMRLSERPTSRGGQDAGGGERGTGRGQGGRTIYWSCAPCSRRSPSPPALMLLVHPSLPLA